MATGHRGRVLGLLGNIPLYGQERQNIEVLAALRDEGWDVLVLTNEKWGHLHVEPELAARGLQWRSVCYAARFDKGIGVRGWLERLRDLARGCAQLRHAISSFRPTHIHVCNPTWFIDFLPVLLASRTPLIYRLGDAPSVHRWPFRALWRIMAWRVSRFVCVSQFIASRLQAATGRSHGVSVIYSRPAARPRATGAGLPTVSTSEFAFAYCGQITEEKGAGVLVDTAIDVCRADSRALFLLAGEPADTPFVKQLHSCVKKEGLAKRIVFVGMIEDVPGLLARAHVHVCPSLWDEPLANAVIEAKASARPSIVFRSGGLPEVVRHGVDGWICEEKTSRALQSACAYYLADPERARAEGLRAKESLPSLGVDTFGERWDAVYDEAGEGPRSTQRGRIVALLGNIPLYGQERQNIEVLAAVQARGWDVLVLTNERWGHLHIEPELDARGLKWQRVRYAARFDRDIGFAGWLERLTDIAKGSRQLFQVIRRIRPTHVHICNPAWFVDFAPALLMCRVPIVYRLGDAPSTHRWLFAALWRVIAWRVAAFVGVSEYVNGELRRIKVSETKIVLIRDTPTRRTGRELEATVRKGRFSFAYVGQISVEKGIAVLVDAAIQVCCVEPDVDVLIAGECASAPEFVAQLVRRVRAAQLDERIVFLGYVHAVPDLLAQAEVHVMPSLCREGLGSAVFEAKEAGRPSIVFPSGGLCESVQHGVDGYVCTGTDADTLAAAMAGYVHDRSRVFREGQAARASLRRLIPANVGESWEGVYRAVSRV